VDHQHGFGLSGNNCGFTNTKADSSSQNVDLSRVAARFAQLPTPHGLTKNYGLLFVASRCPWSGLSQGTKGVSEIREQVVEPGRSELFGVKLHLKMDRDQRPPAR
jgi:hypothetical protein